MFIRKKLLKSMLYDIKEYKRCIEHLQHEIDGVRNLAREGGYILLSPVGICSSEYNYSWHSVPVAKVIEKLFEQKGWDIVRTLKVPAGVEIREFGKEGLSSRRLK